MLSLSCKAGIKSVIYIGSKREDGLKLSIKEIAKQIDENEHTVGKILQKLVKNNIILSLKGPNGGFYIDEKLEQQAIINIVYAIDGKELFHQCALGLKKCSETRPCPFHNDYKPIRDKFKIICEEKKIVDLYKNINSGLSFLIH